jgi:hypothetical protein
MDLNELIPNSLKSSIYLLEPDMRKFYYIRVASIECNKIGRCHAEGLHNEELDDLYSSPNTIRVIKSRRMRLAWHVALWW